ADFFVLIIGGRHGGIFVGSENSITNEEYLRARKRRIPIFTFVKKDVETMLPFYQKNPKADFKPAVEDNRVFDFITSIKSASQDNWIHTFQDAKELVERLGGQFAHVHLLYSQAYVAEQNGASGKKAKDKFEIRAFPTNMPALNAEYQDQEDRTSMMTGLKLLHGILKRMSKEKVDGYAEKVKMLWVFGRHGKVNDDQLWMRESNFKQRAWGIYKGKKVFEQFQPFGVIGSYDDDEDGDGTPTLNVSITFKDDNTGDAVRALAA